MTELAEVSGWTDEGIWEVRGPRRHFTHSKVMAWVVFDRAVRAVEEFGHEGPVDLWRQLCAETHAEVCREGFDAERGTFTQYYGSRELDASALLIPAVGFLPATDPRVLGTIDAIRRELTQDGLVYRYTTERVGAEQMAGHKEWRLLKAPGLRAAVVVGLTLAVLQQFAGINAITYYAPTIMQETGLSASNSILYSVFIGVINFATAIVSLWLIDRVGRRPLLLVSLDGMFVALGFVADLNSVMTVGKISTRTTQKTGPTEDRSVGSGAGSTPNWTATIVVTLALLPLFNTIGQGETFWLIAFWCAFGIWFVARYMPETRGREFLDVDADLQARWRGEVPALAGLRGAARGGAA